jgi:hemerythrin-like metal-binding protein
MEGRTWREGLATGIETVDAEHQLQVTLLDEIAELLRRGADAELTRRAVAQLLDFTSVHFLSEELMMKLYGYPQVEVHREEHARLFGQVREVQRRVGADEAADVDAGELRTWICDHIQRMDQGFARWCVENGIASR